MTLKQYVGDPWERQHDSKGELEPNKWFDRFNRSFRPMGPERSLLGAYNRWRKEKNPDAGNAKAPTYYWTKICDEWNWWERAEAWDAKNRRELIVAEEEARQEMIEHHIKLAKSLQAVGTQRLRDLMEDASSLSPAEARRYISEGIDKERQARGMPQYLLDVIKMEDDELREEYARLVNEVKALESD